MCGRDVLSEQATTGEGRGTATAVHFRRTPGDVVRAPNVLEEVRFPVSLVAAVVAEVEAAGPLQQERVVRAQVVAQAPQAIRRELGATASVSLRTDGAGVTVAEVRLDIGGPQEAGVMAGAGDQVREAGAAVTAGQEGGLDPRLPAPVDPLQLIETACRHVTHGSRQEAQATRVRTEGFVARAAARAALLPRRLRADWRL